MAAHFFDLDGTLVRHHTNDWLPGAKEFLIKLNKQGDDIILVTRRGPHDAGEEWSIENTYNTILRDLEEVGVKYRCMFDIQCPRIIHDDLPCFAKKRERNSSWE